MDRPTVHHIPVCPFSQRLEILLELKGLREAVAFEVVDITRPRDPRLVALAGGSTALPVMELGAGRVLKESLVLLRYLEERFPEPAIARSDPWERAVERLLIGHEGPLTAAGYTMVMNRERSKATGLRDRVLAEFAAINGFLRRHSPEGVWLFDRFGLAEAVFTPILMRFWFLDYYEGFALPATGDFDRVARWRETCLAHPAAQQVSHDQIVKLYYDYAVGAGNGAQPEGRTRSSFAFEPDWRARPMPPKDKYDRVASDAELGLV